ncbi:ABC transporter ATP-binding protein [Aestuariispira insulae]|uniref:Peptide/nickel transport system ATP-binding protein n=1 Tax=Aestuariispira insulae TaxID=1461337 RepID=A0A3D9HWH3_9PROT|nr:ABC transporter ATP-binding protein [Aestuariispira insulae]RED53759.1 peptide/nickel transport system ATP-binding protein [Aestuariispira insulae]
MNGQMTDSFPRPILSVRDLCVDYVTDAADFRAVDHVSFDIQPGEIFGLAGESGCGKSTIAYAVTRLHQPPALISKGSIHLEGQDILALDEKALCQWRWREVSMVFQNAMTALNPVITVAEQFRDVFRAHTNMRRAEIKERSCHLMDLVGIPPERLNDFPHQFSGGMRQRIAIAIALALEPKLIVMDEPTTALDVVVQQEILSEVMRLREQLGFSVLFITHDLTLMSQFCERIGVMLQGRLVELNTAHAISTAPEHDYTASLWRSIPPLRPSLERQKEMEVLL